MIVSTEGDGRDQTVVFGASWCSDCRRTKAWLRRNQVPFTEFDTEADQEARARATTIAGGLTNIPVVVTPEGTVLVEPTSGELADALGGHRRRDRSGGVRCR